MKKIYEEVMSVFKENEKVFVSYYDNVSELVDDGMDLEVVDENHYVFGNPNAAPSELKEPFIMIEVESSSDLPIFVEDRKEDVLIYLKDNHSKLIEEGN